MSFYVIPDAAEWVLRTVCHTSSYVSAREKCAYALVGLAPKNVHSAHTVNWSVAFPQQKRKQ